MSFGMSFLETSFENLLKNAEDFGEQQKVIFFCLSLPFSEIKNTRSLTLVFKWNKTLLQHNRLVMKDPRITRIG